VAQEIQLMIEYNPAPVAMRQRIQVERRAIAESAAGRFQGAKWGTFLPTTAA
jgi:hypothetical protein